MSNLIKTDEYAKVSTRDVYRVNEQFFTTKDLMHRWKCSYYAATCAMRSKVMRAIKISGKFKAKLSDIERYEKQHLYR